MPHEVKVQEWIVIMDYEEGKTILGGFISENAAIEWVTQMDSLDNDVGVYPLYNHVDVEEKSSRDQMDELLDKLEDEGLIAWEGLDEKGEPTFKITEAGIDYAEKISGEEYNES